MIPLDKFYKLVDIRKFLESNVKGFPHNKCQTTSHFLEEILGLKSVAGFYSPFEEWHAWNYDSENKVYIDLTLDQFSKKYDGVTVIPCTAKLLKFNMGIYKENQESLDDYTLKWELVPLINKYSRTNLSY